MGYPNTLVSQLTPAGGDSNDHYFVSDDANLIVDQNFSFLQLSLGIDSGGAKSGGQLHCRAGFTIDAFEPTLSSKETLSIEILGGGKVTDAVATVTTRDLPAIFRGKGANYPQVNIFLRESKGVWDVKFYTLIKSNPLFHIYEDLSTEPFPFLPISHRVDVTLVSEDEGGARFTLQDRFNKLPRFFREGDEGRSVVMDLSFDIESGSETGLWQQLKRIKELNILGGLVTKRRVWPRMRITNVGPIEEVSGQSSFRGSPSITFQEDAL